MTLAAIAATTCILVGSAGAATTYPISPASPVWVTAATASLTMTSPKGDYIGEGKSYSESPPASTFVSRSDENLITIGVTGADGNTWTLELAAPLGQKLAVGTYSTAVDVLTRSGTQAGISIGGDSRGCGSDTGSFKVTKIAFGPDGYVESFNASFSQSCEGVNPPLTGKVKIANAAPPSQAVVKLTQSAKGHLNTTTKAAINGTLTCTGAGTVTLTGTVTEASNGATGAFTLPVTCANSTKAVTWSVVVTATTAAKFKAGTVTAQTSWSTTDTNYQVQLAGSVTTNVTL